MKKSEKPPKQLKKYAVIAICILLLGYFIFAFINSNMNASGVVDTEIAKRYTYNETITAQSIVVRNETLLEYTGSKVLYYTAKDGDIVGAGSEVALVFANETDALDYNRYNEINKQIEVLEGLNTSYDNVKIDYSAVDKQIELNMINIISAVNNNSQKDMSSSVDNLIYSINQRHLITGKVKNFDDRIAELKSEAAQYQQAGYSYIDIINSDSGGYFVASADGYEGCYDYNSLSDLTVDNFTVDIKPREVSENTIGKIVSGLNWYVVCKLSADDAITLSHSNVSPTITFPHTVCKDIPAKLVSLNQESKKSEAIAVFQCNYMNTPISHLRNETAQITVNTYSGLRISKNALHNDYVVSATSDSKNPEKKKVQGVYVTYGSELVFKEVSILYAGSDFLIIDPTPSDGILYSGETVKLNDEIVIKGDNLYEGKNVK